MGGVGLNQNEIDILLNDLDSININEKEKPKKEVIQPKKDVRKKYIHKEYRIKLWKRKTTKTCKYCGEILKVQYLFIKNNNSKFLYCKHCKI